MRYKKDDSGLPNLGRFEINVWDKSPNRCEIQVVMSPDRYNNFLYYFWVDTKSKEETERFRRNSWHKEYVRYRPFNKKPFNQTQLLIWKIANKIAKQTREKNVEKD